MKCFARLFVLLLLTVQTAWGLDYADPKLWVYREREADAAAKPVDVFFVAPTMCASLTRNMDVYSAADRLFLRRAVDAQYGIYTDKARFFAPYYRQKSFVRYTSAEGNAMAYGDVKDAFLYYLRHDNDGRPFILAGYSQGSEHLLHLMQELMTDSVLAHRMVAAYLIGWGVSRGTVKGHPHLHPAEGETDTGVIISWNSEDADVTESLLVPRGQKVYAINPLNWRTDGTPAPAELNLGGCSRSLLHGSKPVPQYCGAVLNTQRGTLNPIFPKGSPRPLINPIFGRGIYHTHEPYFYRENHRRNVVKRIESYLKQQES